MHNLTAYSNERKINMSAGEFNFVTQKMETAAENLLNYFNFSHIVCISTMKKVAGGIKEELQLLNLLKCIGFWLEKRLFLLCEDFFFMSSMLLSRLACSACLSHWQSSEPRGELCDYCLLI